MYVPEIAPNTYTFVRAYCKGTSVKHAAIYGNSSEEKVKLSWRDMVPDFSHFGRFLERPEFPP